VHARHDDVGEQEVDPAVCGGEGTGLFGRGRGQHDVPVAQQNALGERAQAVVVLHQQDRLAAAA
jgi:hypothetical protein